MNEHFIQELTLYLQAKYPLIFVQTEEEERAQRLVEQAVAQLGATLAFPRKQGKGEQIPEILNSVTREETVVLLDTVHRQLDDPETIRTLADFANLPAKQSKTAVIFAPWIRLPRELERLSAICSLPLPTGAELKKLIRSMSPPGTWPFEMGDFYPLVRAAQGLSEMETVRAVRKAIISRPQTVEEAAESIFQEKRRSLQRTQVLEDVPLQTSFGDVGGLDQLKEWLHSRREAFSPRAKQYGLPAPKGLLLTGIQGCGKSLSAKATASYWNLPLVRLDLSAVFGSPFPEEALRGALQVAEAMAPVVLWIDEIEKGFDKDGVGASSRLLGGMVTWLQEKDVEVFVVATANRVSHLPAELPRKGRFDEVFFVDLPDVHERKQIFKLHLERRGKDPDGFSLELLAKKSERFTGSEVEQVVISAMYAAFSRGQDLSEGDLLRAIKECIPLYDTFEEEIKELREWARKRARSASTNRTKIDLFAGQ